MISYSKCTQVLCPLASTCYRIQGPSGVWQSFMTFEYQIGVTGVTCDHYIECPGPWIMATDNTKST